MLKQRREIESQMHQLIDLVLLMGCMYAAHTIRRLLGAEFQTQFQLRSVVMFRDYAWLAFATAAITHFSLKMHGFYHRPMGLPPARVFLNIARSMTVGVLVLLAALFITNIQEINRSTVFLYGIIATGVVWVFDMAWQGLILMSASFRPERRAVVLVGSSEENKSFQSLISKHAEWGIEVAAQIDLKHQSTADLVSLLQQQPIDIVLFTASKSFLREVEASILACEVEGVEAWLVADFIRTSISRPSLDELMGHPMIVFRSAPEVSWSLLLKVFFDRVSAAILLIVLSPLFLLLATLVKLSSPGPIFFRQKRCGLRGRVFTMYKFRSMVTNAEQLHAELSQLNEMDGPVFKIAGDPRITSLGAYLRRTSLDELPQLYNVLKGEMSLVGPRPLPVYEVKRFKDPWQRRRLSMKPGLTCLWQIAGRNKIGFEEWMRLDLQYIDNWSLWMDIKILVKTIPVLFSGRGAH